MTRLDTIPDLLTTAAPSGALVPATTHENRAMVLATLSHLSRAAIISYLKVCAAGQSTDMLESALKEGLYCANKNSPEGKLATFEAVETVFDLLDNVRKQNVSKGHKGESLRVDVNVAVLEVTPSFAGFINKLTSAFIVNANQMLDEPDTGLSPCQSTIVNRTAAGLMALASAIDQPQTLQSLIDAFPQAMRTMIPASFAGECFEREFRNVESFVGTEPDCQYTPPFFAIHYSSELCIDVFVACGWKGFEPIGSWPNPGPDETCDDKWDDLRKWDPATERTGINLIDMLKNDALHCQPSALRKAFNLFKNKEGQWRVVDHDSLMSEVLDVMDPDLEKYYGYLPALLDTGVFDQKKDRVMALEKAAEHGSTETFDHFQERMPWEGLLVPGKSLLQEVLTNRAIDEEINEDHFVCLALQIIELAKRDGQKGIFNLIADCQDQVQPLKAIIDLENIPLLFEFLKNGIDPDESIGDTGKCLNTMLEEAGAEDLQHMVRTFVARRDALDALDEISFFTRPQLSLP